MLSDTLAKEEKDKIRKQKAREQLLKLNQRKRENRVCFYVVSGCVSM